MGFKVTPEGEINGAVRSCGFNTTSCAVLREAIILRVKDKGLKIALKDKLIPVNLRGNPIIELDVMEKSIPIDIQGACSNCIDYMLRRCPGLQAKGSDHERGLTTLTFNS